MLTTEHQSTIPIFYLHEGDHPFCTRPGCRCMQNDTALEALLRDVIEGKLKLRQVVNGTIVGEGINGRAPQGS